MASNKVLFGFKNVYYSKITESGTTITYGTPTKFANEGGGGVSIALSPRGESFEKYADDVLWFADAVNQGYEGDLVITNVTDSFKKAPLGVFSFINFAFLDIKTVYATIRFR